MMPDIHIVNGRVDHGDDSVTSACGVELSTWDTPIRYVFPHDRDAATCPACLELVPPLERLSPDELEALLDRLEKKLGFRPPHPDPGKK